MALVILPFDDTSHAHWPDELDSAYITYQWAFYMEVEQELVMSLLATPADTFLSYDLHPAVF